MKKREAATKRQIIVRAVFALFAILPLAALYAVANLDARTIPGDALFKWRYAHTSDYQTTLKNYRAQIWEHGGGYLPPSGDEFLRDRFLISNSPEEISAIVDFYVSQGSGRPSALLPQMSLSERFRFVSIVMQHLDNYKDLYEQQGAFVLIEQLRTQTRWNLMKANVHSIGGKSYGKGWEWRWNNVELPEIKALYRRWWNKTETPAAKFARSPVEHSDYKIEAV